MRTLAKFLAGVCAIFFVITGVLALLFFNIERKAFAAETYKRAFEKQQLYDRMPGILAEILTNVIGQNAVTNAYLKSFTVQDWESFVSALLPPEELKFVANNTLDSIFDYLNSRTNSVIISLLPFKRHLVSPEGVGAVFQLLHARPDCTVDQILEMTSAFLSGGELIFCNPPPEAVQIMTPLIQAQLQLMTIAIPDQITLNSKIARAIMQIIPLLPMAFLLGVTIFAVRGLIDWLKWWGWPFLFTGVISLLIAVLGSSLVGYIIQWVLESQVGSFTPPILLLTIRETVSAIA